MADIDFKNGVNADTAYVDGHKVKLIAVPDGSLELPISANDEYGYVVDANGKKHRVLLVTFLEGEPDYKQSPTADTAYMTVNSQKVKVRLGAKLNGTQYLSDSANVNDCYTEDDDSNKHRTILVSEPTGTLELPTSETSDSAYVIDNDGNKHKVRLFAVLAGGTTIVEVTVSGVPPLNLLGAVEDSLSSVKAYGGLLQSSVPTPSDPVDLVCNNGKISVLDHTNWNVITNPDSEAGKGIYIGATGNWVASNSRNGGVIIPITVGKQYTLVLHQKTTALGSLLKFGQSDDSEPPANASPLTDYHSGTPSDGMIISFLAKKGYFVLQMGYAFLEAGGANEAIEVLEAQGDNETLDITTKNLFDADKVLGQRTQYTKESNGDWTVSVSDGTGWGQLYTSGLFITLSAGTYTLSSTEAGVFFSYADASSSSEISDLNGGSWYALPKTFTVTQPTNFTVKIKRNIEGSWVYPCNIGKIQLEQGSKATDYIDYNGSTAGVANLLKISNYVDTQEILTGLINHKLGIYVFDGTEDWTWSNGANAPARLNIPELDYVLNEDVAPVMCSHFMPTYWNNLSPTTKTTPYVAINQTNQPTAKKIVFTTAWDANITDAESWKTFLATQYSAGTPVIVVYPLATAQDEVAPIPQTMQTVAGDNTLDIVQAGMSGLEVSATYMKGVSVTITEIEDANIGNSVEVVIA